MKKLKTIKSLIIVILILHIIFFTPNQSSSQPIENQINDSFIKSSKLSEPDQSLSVTGSEQSADPVKSLDFEEIITMPKVDTQGPVLLLHADNPAVGDYVISFLSNHGIVAEQFPVQLMSYTPSLADLSSYQIVVVWTNFLPQDPITTGNVLADYVDTGGSVVMVTYSHSPIPSSGIDGRFFGDQYSAFIKTGAPNVGGRTYDGSSSHPIFNGVNSFQTITPTEEVVVDGGATLVASYTDTAPFVATKGRVVNMNAWLGASGWTGDYDLILANAINYLYTSDVLLLYSDLAAAPTTISDLITPYGYSVDVMVLSEVTPLLSMIKWYPVVISWTNTHSPVDNTAWGDLLADYVDSGGTLIMMPFTYFEDPWSLEGRFLGEKYSPFDYVANTSLARNYDGGSSHPIFDGVSGYTTAMAMDPFLRFGARTIATYDDGTLFVALKGSVIGINSYIPSNTGGDIPLILANTIEFLMSGMYLDADAPVITSPNDIVMEFGSVGEQIAWTLYDANPTTYDLQLDGNPMESGPWTNGMVVWIDLNGFGLGNHTFELTVLDLLGYSTINVAIVSVVDTTLPTITNPGDIEIYERDIGNIIWKLEDLLPNDYIVTRNGTEIMADTWTSGDEITVVVENLIVGLHIFEIMAIDSSGNAGIDSVSVTILSLGIPLIAGPADINFIEGDYGRKITWYISDNDPTTYVVERDGFVLDDGSYVGLPFIEVLLLNYTNGYYNFTLTLHDVFGNTISDTVFVRVLIRNPAGSGSSPSPSGDAPPRFFDNPVVIGVTAGIIILGGGILFLRRRV